MRRAFAPILATGVVLAGAATVVANPVLDAPADIRVSATDLQNSGNRLDILDPHFLESIGAVRQGWPSAVATLNVLLTSLAEDPSSVSPTVFAQALQRVSEIDPAALAAFTAESANTAKASVPVINDPTESTVVVLRALANLSSGFTEAGVTLIRQVGMAPAMILNLAEQVLDGTVPPADALRRVITAPLGAAVTGQTVITGDPKIDAVFQNSVIKPILDAIDATQPPSAPVNASPTRTPAPNAQATPVPTTNDIPAQQPSTVASGPSNPALNGTNDDPATDGGDDPASGSNASSPDPAAEVDADAPSGYKPGDITRRITKEIRKALDDLGTTVRRLIGIDGPDGHGTRPGDNGNSGADSGSGSGSSSDGGSSGGDSSGGSSSGSGADDSGN